MIEGHVPDGHTDLATWVQQHFPSRDPNWDANNQAHQECQEGFWQALTEGMKEVAKKTMDVNKAAEVLQGPNESLGVFLEWLYDTCHTYLAYQ